MMGKLLIVVVAALSLRCCLPSFHIKSIQHRQTKHHNSPSSFIPKRILSLPFLSFVAFDFRPVVGVACLPAMSGFRVVNE